MKRNNLYDLLIFVLSAELAGVLSSLFAGDISAVYDTLEKPPLSPRQFPTLADVFGLKFDKPFHFAYNIFYCKGGAVCENFLPVQYTRYPC